MKVLERISKLTQDLQDLKQINNSLIDVPACIMSNSEENEMLFNYCLTVVDCVYQPMIELKFLKPSQCIELYETLLLKRADLFASEQESKTYILKGVSVTDTLDLENKLNEIDQYLNDKLFEIMTFAMEKELFEVMSNVQLYRKCIADLVKIDFM